MNSSNYTVEFNGYDYVVLFGARVVAAFGSSEEAYHAKRAFEDKPKPSAFDKTPPAMRLAKAQYHGQNLSH